MRFLAVSLVVLLIAGLLVACSPSDSHRAATSTFQSAVSPNAVDTSIPMTVGDFVASSTEGDSTTTSHSSPPVPLEGWVWSRIEDDGLADSAQLWTVAGSESGFIAGGSGAIWTSEDGMAWHRAPHGPGAEFAVRSVVPRGRGWLAVGFIPDGETSSADAAVLVSDDGETWRQFGGGLPARPGNQEMWSVAAGGPGFVAVGHEETDTNEGDLAVWLSEDGLDWERVLSASFGGPGDQVSGDGGDPTVTAGGPGLVVVGYDSNTVDGFADPAVWVSPDGFEWSRANTEGLTQPGNQQIWSVSSGGPGLVAVGIDEAGGSSDAAVWASEDGYVWERINSPSLEAPGDQGMASVASIDGGLVAVGWDWTETKRNAIWVSPDGIMWQRIPDETIGVVDPSQSMLLSIAGNETGLAAVGALDGAAIWTAHNNS